MNFDDIQKLNYTERHLDQAEISEKDLQKIIDIKVEQAMDSKLRVMAALESIDYTQDPSRHLIYKVIADNEDMTKNALRQARDNGEVLLVDMLELWMIYLDNNYKGDVWLLLEAIIEAEIEGELL